MISMGTKMNNHLPPISDHSKSSPEETPSVRSAAASLSALSDSSPLDMINMLGLFVQNDSNSLREIQPLARVPTNSTSSIGHELHFAHQGDLRNLKHSRKIVPSLWGCDSYRKLMRMTAQSEAAI